MFFISLHTKQQSNQVSFAFSKLFIVQCGILSCACLELKNKKFCFQDLKMPLFQACPEQKLSLSRSETVQIRVVHCNLLNNTLTSVWIVLSICEYKYNSFTSISFVRLKIRQKLGDEPSLFPTILCMRPPAPL